MDTHMNQPRKLIMTLKNKKTLETFTFESAAELQKWLNQFNGGKYDLDTVYFDTPSGRLTFHWEIETLSDGSKVNNIRVSC